MSNQEINHLIDKIKDKESIVQDKQYKMNFNKDDFKTPEPYHFEHRGTNYVAIFDSGVEEDNKGFVVHNISLIDLDNENIAGYMQMFYLPEENLNEYYPSIPYFLSTKQGQKNYLSKVPRVIDTSHNSPWEDKSLDEKIETMKNIFLYIDHNSYHHFLEELDKNNINEKYLDKLFQAVEENLNKTVHYNRFQSFKNTHLNKPMPEFIRVNNKGQKGLNLNLYPYLTNLHKYMDENNISEQKIKSESTVEYSKKGLGAKLYKFAADWLSHNKLSLYMGGTNEHSGFFWDSYFKNNSDFNIIETESGNKYLKHNPEDSDYLIFKRKNEGKKNKKHKAVKLK